MQTCPHPLRAMLGLADMYRGFADIFGVIGVHDPFPSASETFTAVGITHRELEVVVVVDVDVTIRPMHRDDGSVVSTGPTHLLGPWADTLHLA
jgi:hypothetical protein